MSYFLRLHCCFARLHCCFARLRWNFARLRWWCLILLVLLGLAACDKDCPPGTTLYKGRDAKVGRYVQTCARNGSIGRHGLYREFYDTSGKHLARQGDYKEDLPFGLFVIYDAKGNVDAVECFGADGKRKWKDTKAKEATAGGRACL